MGRRNWPLEAIARGYLVWGKVWDVFAANPVVWPVAELSRRPTATLPDPMTG